MNERRLSWYGARRYSSISGCEYQASFFETWFGREGDWRSDSDGPDSAVVMDETVETDIAKMINERIEVTVDKRVSKRTENTEDSRKMCLLTSRDDDEQWSRHIKNWCALRLKAGSNKDYESWRCRRADVKLEHWRLCSSPQCRILRGYTFDTRGVP